MAWVFICTGCGKDIKEGKMRGGMKHPLCDVCYRDGKKRRIWVEELKLLHPPLYELYKNCLDDP